MTERVAAVVEGDLDAAVIRHVALTAGLVADPVHIKRGKQNVRGRIAGYKTGFEQLPRMGRKRPSS